MPETIVPRVDRTFAFVDLCGFTDFDESHGDDLAAEVLHVLRATVREAATNHGVRIDKWAGDGAMLVAVEPAALLAAVVEMRWALEEEIPLRLRTGNAAGPVMVFEGEDYVGRVINLASRLCDIATPSQCVAPVELAPVCPVGLVATSVGRHHVSGFHDDIDLVAIDVADDDAGRHRRGLAAALGRSVHRDAASGAAPT